MSGITPPGPPFLLSFVFVSFTLADCVMTFTICRGYESQEKGVWWINLLIPLRLPRALNTSVVAQPNKIPPFNTDPTSHHLRSSPLLTLRAGVDFPLISCPCDVRYADLPSFFFLSRCHGHKSVNFISETANPLDLLDHRAPKDHFECCFDRRCCSTSVPRPPPMHIEY